MKTLHFSILTALLICIGSLILITAPPLLAEEKVKTPSAEMEEVLSVLEKEFEPVSLSTDDDKIPWWHGLRNVQGVKSVLVCWKISPHDSLELAWYKSYKRQTRLLILAIFYSEYLDPDISFLPEWKGNTRDFAPEKKAERLEEIEYVKLHIEKIRPRVKKLLERVTVKGNRS